jgi:hypothetical protein
MLKELERKLAMLQVGLFWELMPDLLEVVERPLLLEATESLMYRAESDKVRISALIIFQNSIKKIKM